MSSLIPQQGGLGVLADIDRIYGTATSNAVNQNEINKRKAQMNSRKRVDDIEDGYENTTGGDNTDFSNRGGVNSNVGSGGVRHSKSANAARSLTRKNQQ